MTTNVQGLFATRYKIKNDYPHNPYKIGDIMVEYTIGGWKVTVTYSGSFNDQEQVNTYPSNYLDQRPHLFEKLPWHADRDVSEMPMYVSYISLTRKDKYYPDGNSDDNFIKARIFHKVAEWRFMKNPFGSSNKPERWMYQKLEPKGDTWYEIYDSSLPHTAEEYETYKHQHRNN